MINLTLVSHTNVGKTSLMRTLLRRDIGEVADRAHVTEVAESHELLRTTQDEPLLLWDTPGFGDSIRLLKRLEASGNPVGWLMTQVWDRLTDRPFFCSQRAIHAVRTDSDVVLYLVNASEDPAGAAYVDAELRILGWIGKPVLVLLNQTGPARGRTADAADEAAWGRALAAHVQSHRVIALDAFARCWVQEDRLLGAVDEMLPQEKRAAFARMRDAWRVRNLEVFDESMAVLAKHLAGVAGEREALAHGGAQQMMDGARRFIASLGKDQSAADPETERAMKVLARRYDESVRESTDRLIALHGLSGRARDTILARVARQFEVAKPADVKATSIMGGMVTGALGGLAADAAAAGMTFGAGALIGGILGAIGAGSAAQAYNTMHGIEEGRVRWSPAFLRQRPADALLRYLAVAHFGRGRGEFVRADVPEHWQRMIGTNTRSREALASAWQSASAGDLGRTEQQLTAALTELARDILNALYPDSKSATQSLGSN